MKYGRLATPESIEFKLVIGSAKAHVQTELVPAFGMLASGFLMLQPHRETRLRFAIWRVVGLSIYFHYGCKHRLVNPNSPWQDERVVPLHGKT